MPSRDRVPTLKWNSVFCWLCDTEREYHADCEWCVGENVLTRMKWSRTLIGDRFFFFLLLAVWCSSRTISLDTRNGAVKFLWCKWKANKKKTKTRSNRCVLRSRWICCALFFAFCVCFPTTNFTHSLQQHSLNYLQSLSLRCCFCYQSAAAAILLHLPLLWRQKTKFIKANREKANTSNNNSGDSNSEKRQKNETTNSSDIYLHIHFAHSHAPGQTSTASWQLEAKLLRSRLIP